MSIDTIHLQQARHNKELAYYLLGCPYKDWIVTACFYAAVHLVEAMFYVLKPNQWEHSETTIPARYQGGFHGWRKQIVSELVAQGRLSQDFLNIFKNLQIQSNIARYLILQSSGHRRGVARSINTLASDYFSESQIEDFLELDLEAMERELVQYNIYLPSP